MHCYDEKELTHEIFGLDSKWTRFPRATAGIVLRQLLRLDIVLVG
jgi:hypothetical protein